LSWCKQQAWDPTPECTRVTTGLRAVADCRIELRSNRFVRYRVDVEDVTEHAGVVHVFLRKFMKISLRDAQCLVAAPPDLCAKSQFCRDTAVRLAFQQLRTGNKYMHAKAGEVQTAFAFVLRRDNA
jgi:hypothetical protein